MKRIKKIVIDLIKGICLGVACGLIGWLVSQFTWNAAMFINGGG